MGKQKEGKGKKREWKEKNNNKECEWEGKEELKGEEGNWKEKESRCVMCRCKYLSTMMYDACIY